jgi:hypothetical protein
VDQTARSWYHTAKVTVAPTTVPVRPVSVAASSQLKGHEAQFAVDGYSDTYWEVDLRQDPHPVLTLNFSGPTDLVYAYFRNGTADKYTEQPRPKNLHITYSDGSSQDITLQDKHDAYGVELHARNVTWMKIQVMSVYDAIGSGPNSKIMALAEIELFMLE